MCSSDCTVGANVGVLSPWAHWLNAVAGDWAAEYAGYALGGGATIQPSPSCLLVAELHTEVPPLLTGGA